MANPGTVRWQSPALAREPAVLSKEALEELRLMALYPNAADLLATVDELLDALRDARSVLRLADRSDAWRVERDRIVARIDARIEGRDAS